MATFEDLYTRRLDRLLNSNDSNTLFTSTRRQEAINDGYQEFAALTECYQRRSTVSVSCNTTEYVLSTISEFTRISEQGLVEYHRLSSGGGSSAKLTQQAGFDLERRDELWLNRYEPGWRMSTSPVRNPSAYYVRFDGGQAILGLSDPPNVGSSETAKLIVPFVARPEPMSASTQIPFTDTNGNSRHDLAEYHQAFVHYGAAQLLPLIGDFEAAAAHLQAFQGYVQRYRENTRPRGGQHVTVARNYLREGSRGRGGWDDGDARWLRQG